MYVADDRSVPRRDQGLPLQNNPRLRGEQTGQRDLPPPDQLEVRRPGLVELDHETLCAEIAQEEVIHRHLRANKRVCFEKKYNKAKSQRRGKGCSKSRSGAYFAVDEKNVRRTLIGREEF